MNATCIDTRIPGHPGAIRGWADLIEESSTDLAEAATAVQRSSAEIEWFGTAAAAYEREVEATCRTLEHLSGRAQLNAALAREYAGALDHAQRAMLRVVQRCRAAGLQVRDGIVYRPGGAAPQLHAERAAVFEAASSQADRIRGTHAEALAQLNADRGWAAMDWILQTGLIGADQVGRLDPEGLGRAARLLNRGAFFWGIKQDIDSGESITQAVTSNAGGLAAGALVEVAAAAAVGGAAGSTVPVLGTAAGVVVGVGVGIVTSQAIDTAFEEGPDVGRALDAGWDALGDTLGDVVAVGDTVIGAVVE